MPEGRYAYANKRPTNRHAANTIAMSPPLNSDTSPQDTRQASPKAATIPVTCGGKPRVERVRQHKRKTPTLIMAQRPSYSDKTTRDTDIHHGPRAVIPTPNAHTQTETRPETKSTRKHQKTNPTPAPTTMPLSALSESRRDQLGDNPFPLQRITESRR